MSRCKHAQPQTHTHRSAISSRWPPTDSTEHIMQHTAFKKQLSPTLNSALYAALTRVLRIFILINLLNGFFTEQHPDANCITHVMSLFCKALQNTHGVYKVIQPLINA